ncbi:MAG TPA: DUF6639 family protein [Gammaproteobacteria bacterium]
MREHHSPKRLARPWLLAAGLALAAGPAAALATTLLPCASQPIEVEGDAAHAQEVCAAGLTTLARLAELGLAPARTIRIVLVDAGILHGGDLAFGKYDGASDRLELMSPAAIASQQPPPQLFGQPMDGPMYVGLVAHELTHAVAAQAKRSDRLGSPAQEYLAYAVQLASLPAALRETIVAAAKVAAWEPGDEVSLVYLGLDVHRFAVKSYLHLYHHPDRPAALAAVLASRGNRTFSAP